MVKRIALLALAIFFVAGTFGAMAEEQRTSNEMNPLQMSYDWFASWTSPCAKKTQDRYGLRRDVPRGQQEEALRDQGQMPDRAKR